MKTHKDVYMSSFLIQELLNSKKQNTLAVQDHAHGRQLAVLGVGGVAA